MVSYIWDADVCMILVGVLSVAPSQEGTSPIDTYVPHKHERGCGLFEAQQYFSSEQCISETQTSKYTLPTLLLGGETQSTISYQTYMP